MSDHSSAILKIVKVHIKIVTLSFQKLSVRDYRLQTCHLIYANKSYIIEREDNQWRKDLDECRQFLRENGY